MKLIIISSWLYITLYYGMRIYFNFRMNELSNNYVIIEKEMQELIKENRDLEAENAHLQSLEYAQQVADKQGFKTPITSQLQSL